jgi:hypothetical protein
MGSPNPGYGSGVFRRRLHWRALEGLVEVELEDSNHGFRLQLHHDGRQITDVTVEPVRFPFTTCPEAMRGVQHIIGRSLENAAETTTALREQLPQANNCTHMVDMSLLAAAHVHDVGSERFYDIAVADECDDVTHARIDCDGQRIHEWSIRAHNIETPAELAGKPVMRGFFGWATGTFSGMPLEAAQALQRGYFVAQARRWSYEPIEQHPASTDGMPLGSCYSYNTGAVERALRIQGSVRDCSESSERLLQFVATPCRS